ncbi:MAG: hypothetical protein RLZZ11_728 [Cyanobacteriota bacterium]
MDLARGTIDPQTLGFQPLLGRGQIVDVAGELHHHGAALIGRDLGPQDLGGDIELHRQAVGDRLMHRLAGKCRVMRRFTLRFPLPTSVTSTPLLAECGPMFSLTP